MEFHRCVLHIGRYFVAFLSTPLVYQIAYFGAVVCSVVNAKMSVPKAGAKIYDALGEGGREAKFSLSSSAIIESLHAEYCLNFPATYQDCLVLFLNHPVFLCLRNIWEK